MWISDMLSEVSHKRTNTLWFYLLRGTHSGQVHRHRKYNVG
jgi:hypothetical protein